MRTPVELAKAYRLLNHGPTVIVTSAHAGRRNVMAAAWVMPVDFNPPKIAVVVDARSYTRELIEASGEFALNLPPRAFAAQTVAVGSVSGRDVDKFAAEHLETFAAEKIGAPLLAGCIAWLECRLLPEPGIGQRHDLLVAEVLAAAADDRVFTRGHWHFNDDSLRTIHHIAGGEFFVAGPAFAIAARAG